MDQAVTMQSCCKTIDVPDAVLGAIQRMERPVVISHVVPDADALGSAFAMARALTNERRSPTVALPEGSLSQRLSFLLDMAGISIATDEDFSAADGFIVCDTAKKPRCNVGLERKDSDWSADRVIVNIDHHETNTNFGDVNWIVGEASSACELVYHFLCAADRPIDQATASLLYAGIQTDTLGFSLPTATASALHAGGDLVGLGADVALLGEKLGRSQSKSEFDLLRIIYANTSVLAGGEIAYSSASYQEIQDAGCSAADIDDQINVPRSVDGARLAMLFTEGRQGKTRINFRGSGNVTVIDLAAKFKGGGHSQAAGAIVDADLVATIAKVLPEAESHLSQFGPAS